MATIPTLSYAQSEESVIQQLLNAPLPQKADLFQVADLCATFVCVLVETDDSKTRAALCERLLQTLNQLRALCDKDLPPYLIEQLIKGEKISSNVPDLWQETATLVDYAQALAQAVQGETLPPGVAKELTGLLHDMVWLLADFVKEPYITAH
ncbi:hypothetical protein QQF54_22520 [Lelliottia sp. V106_10]|jgi:hypothetical protein|uniref:hypothetical protein n=1 Tax=Lelliottia wanjuensis TaxID=3050585 RepID=UPI00249F27F7|nr:MULTISPECIES: hypothetical protein [unclassified Lelliottia]MDI3361307.1 hypothetical protein [Lelliottia sp. V89_13]MDK9358611.1 hypothetical protein [Lelliottia sp. V106_16]MDK9376113.1 hypothetical protein [Lelliottia sp. V106_10]MDK9549892.1 hypothetical protein [Lelliottia sp. V89_5]MDK9595891.1 hypothetical protein [Lelliottia sp. V89_10]